MVDLQLDSDAEAALDLWGEQVTYTPSGGTGRAIVAIVTREPAAQPPGAPRGQAPSLTVQVTNRATAYGDDGYGGIAVTEIDTHADTVTLPGREGGDTQARRIAEIIEQDAGMVRLRLA